VKNLLVFFPLIFAGQLLNANLLVKTTFGFFAFSFVASAVYIFNDVRDLESDRQHDTKKNRPLASGAVSSKKAIALAALLLFAALFIGFLFNNNIYAWIFLFLYLLINVLYSLGLKNVPLLDISIIVAGFILRIVYGGAIASISISSWLYLTVIAMSFYLALGKRRNEIQKTGRDSRTVLKHYTEDFLDKNMHVCMTLTIVFYSLWCTSSNHIIGNSQGFIWTIPVVLLICMRYSMDIEGDNHGDPADVLFYVLLLAAIVYFPLVFRGAGIL
jgi:decaprenyl-phosphate phosphoribosyltransferase